MFFHLDSLKAFGDRPCLVLRGGKVTTYVELADMAETFARRLPKDRGLIAIEMNATPAVIGAYIGALAAGHAVMPLPAGDPETARNLEARFRPVASLRKTGGRRRLLTHDWQLPDLHPELALLLQTSGSTGHGSGVRLSSEAVGANARAIAEYLEIGADDRAALVLPLHYSYGLSVLHSHLSGGASLWLAPGSVLDAEFAGQLAQSGATSLAGVPHHFRLLESAGLAEALPDGMRTLTVAGGAMPPEQVLQWDARMRRRGGRFVVMYGQTEATARISWLPPERVAAHPDAIGIAIPGGRMFLRDGDGHEVSEPEAEGELVYEGPNVMMGYASDFSDLSRPAELDVLATGDLARCGADGNFRITGRLSRMSKIAGLRIGHDALERALAEQGHEAAVWGDDRTIAVAVRGPEVGVAEKAAQLAGVGRQHFQVLSLADLPRRPNGKIDYPALKAKAAALSAPPDHGVLAAFQSAFAPRAVGRNDSFASLGGDSLRHVELSLALDTCLGGAPDGWEKMPIGKLEQARPNHSSRLPAEIMARALAILAVVTAHQTLWPVYGGAAAMVMLMGMSVASYRWEALKAGEFRAFFLPMTAVLVPYYLILAVNAAVWGQVPWASVVLLGNLALTTPETHLMLPYLYWFVEAYVQMTLLVAAPFVFPPLRNWLARHGRFAVGLGLLAFAVALRVTVPEMFPMHGRAQFTVPWVFYLFALGWCIVSARTPAQRLILLGAACLIMPMAAYMGGNWYGGWIKYMSLLALAALLIFVPRIPAPRVLVRPVMRLAQAAFPIYLLHRFVPELLLPLAGIEGDAPWVDALAIAGGLAIGLVVADLQRHLGKTGFVWRSRQTRAQA